MSRCRYHEDPDYGVEASRRGDDDEAASRRYRCMETRARRSPSRTNSTREQARVQVASRGLPTPVYETLTPAPDFGLALRLHLPRATSFWIWKAIPSSAKAGLSICSATSGSMIRVTSSTTHDWAFTREEERQAFERFVDFVMARREQYPDLHIYHYAPYEPGAVKRLMGRYATREDEIDRLLRGRFFVDLYSIVRQAIRASVESYSHQAA